MSEKKKQPATRRANTAPKATGPKAPKAPKAPKPPKESQPVKAKPVTKVEALSNVAIALEGMNTDSTAYRPLTADEQTEVNGLIAANKLKVSPMADMMPKLSSSGLAGLAEDIRSRGQMNPILLLRVKDTNQVILIDGRNRLAATKIAEVAPIFAIREVDKSTATQVQFRDTFSLNIIRRQASGSQLATVGADLFDLIGEKIQADLIAKRKKQLEDAGERFDASTTEKDANSFKESVRDIIAAMLSGLSPRQIADGVKPIVSGRYIDMARELKAGASDLFEKVKNGELVLKKALAELKLRDNPPAADNASDVQGSASSAEVKPEFMSQDTLKEMVGKARQGKVLVDRAKLAGMLAQLDHYINKYGYEVPGAVTTTEAPESGDDSKEGDDQE